MSQQRRRRMAENYLVIWVDGNINIEHEDCQHTLSQLRGVVNEVKICSKAKECIELLNGNKLETCFVISSGELGQALIPNIHGMENLDTIYIYSRNKELHIEWAKHWTKINGVHDSIKSITEALQVGVKQCNQNNTIISIISSDVDGSIEKLNQLEPSFMYTQIFKEILLDMEHDQQDIKDLVTFWQQQYQGNEKALKIIDEFQDTYRPSNAIWWYTSQCFTYQIINQALRTLDGDIIIRMGFYLCDVHRQIEELYNKQINQYHGKTFLLYRGQGLQTADFEKITKSKGGLISFNTFLSTSKDRDVSLVFANGALGAPDMVGVLFQMTIDPTKSSTPFASIREVSYYQEEEEILFSMHTVFRIGEVRKIDPKNPLYEVDLKLTADDDQQLHQLTNRIRQETCGRTGWDRMGQLLVRIGQFDKAEELYTALLEQASEDSDKAHIYHNLGIVKSQQGQYEKDITFYEKALEISRKTLPEDHPSLANTYNNIGAAYNKMGDYSKALEYYEKAHKIKEKALSPDDLDLALSYSNIGVVYDDMGEYSKVLEFYEKALKIREKALPPYHPDLAISYDNFGTVYKSMGNYLKAFEFYEKASKIFEKSLPPNHPELATAYNNIGTVYKNMGDYSKALEFHEKSHKIWEKALPPNHPSLATSYNNISQVYNSMGDYSKALEIYEKAHQIFEKSVSPNHPDLAASYNNIGLVYLDMGDYSKALEFYEKALKIYKKSVSPNHPSLAASYNNIGSAYNDMGDYAKALEFYEKSHKILEKTLPANHPNLVFPYNWFGKIYRSIKDYPKALENFEKCLSIFQNALPEGHPHQAITYSNIGDVHRLTGDYEKALSFHRKALNIQENLQCNPLECALTYINLGETYREMKDYSTALTYFQKGLEIRQKNLPKDHPDLAIVYHNIAKLYLSTRKYSMAMKNVQQAVEIAQEKLPSTHPDLLEYTETFEKIRRKM
ncbi:unnamed protein product [Rotaria sp. Silwood1]|nr:unnamed protein product [Rotaria sp. Silwood1]CAF1638491.1 unnamed protein product [Rotaria sp. Silwood1]CAF3835732.1 unnamed protein product [Rotaria sp. Silwood1]CAF3998148.1 unnamed protein product [Rotaria sp. Silwood1]CAF4964729.1 unnamed protein product [Rotaria sp. Silwood1]